MKAIKRLRDSALIPEHPVPLVRSPRGLSSLYLALFWERVNEKHGIWQLWQADFLTAIHPRIALGVELQPQNHLGIEAPRRLLLYIICFLFGFCIRPAHYFAQERTFLENGSPGVPIPPGGGDIHWKEN